MRKLQLAYLPSADFMKFLSEGGVDAIPNVTPDSLHAPLSLQAIAAGKHTSSVRNRSPQITSIRVRSPRSNPASVLWED
jgi:hypothetical protein